MFNSLCTHQDLDAHFSCDAYATVQCYLYKILASTASSSPTRQHIITASAITEIERKKPSFVKSCSISAPKHTTRCRGRAASKDLHFSFRTSFAPCAKMMIVGDDDDDEGGCADRRHQRCNACLPANRKNYDVSCDDGMTYTLCD